MIQMTIRDSMNRYWLITIAAIFFAAAVFIHHKNPRPPLKVTKQESTYTLNGTFIKMVSFGNKRVISNLFWILTLMESDVEKYKKKDFADWMYVRFHTISQLDPRFYQNYLYGGMYLSVIKDDLEGAAEIFEMGLKEYPDDYHLNYYAGFNYFYEMGQFQKGYEKLKKLENHPKMHHLLRSVMAKLNFELTHDYEVAIGFLTENIRLNSDQTIIAKLRADLYAVTAQRDLECLNSGKKGCYLVDADGKSYVKDSNGKWKSYKNFKPYKIFRSERVEGTHPTSR